MNRLFNMDNPFFTFMNKVADILLLNIIALVCCIPIVTIGASLTATYYVTLKIARDEESYVTKSFFKSFRENFKQATIIHLITLVIGAILWVDAIFFLGITKNQAPSLFTKIVISVFSVTVALIFFVYLYIYPILAKFYNTIGATIQNAFLMAIRHLPYTLLIALISLLPFGIVFIPIAKVQFFLLPIIFLFGISGIAMINSKFFVKIFDHYIETENNDETVE